MTNIQGQTGNNLIEAGKKAQPTWLRDLPPNLPSRQKSRVTNGKQPFVAGGNGNSPWTRQWKDLTQIHIADLGVRDLLSEAELSLIRRASAIEVELEMFEADMSASLPVDIGTYCATAAHLRRLFETLGLKRRPRDVSSDDDDEIEGAADVIIDGVAP